MKNQHIQIGIDLGTTNSEIAINKDGKVEVIGKPGGIKYFPSVFGYDKAKNKILGKKAYDRLYLGRKDDFENIRAEIKRVMGTSESTHFKRVDLKLLPEEISAEILKGLKEELLKKYPDFSTISAIITVPAAFSALQSEATRRAGNLAGFEYVVLLQEPIAAAVSYGLGNTKNEKWLIYDLGGGTFDVALVSLNDGNLSVLSNNGDNFLGGKNIDWDLVDKIIVPKIVEKYKLTNFARDNKQYKGFFAKLKYLAENAKIELSQNNSTLIEVGTDPNIQFGVDEDGKEIEISFELSRTDFEKLIKPLVDRTIELSKETLIEAEVKSNEVKKIVLVGGPTQIPYIRKRLEKDLKISIDSSVDPLTVVAQGASIYAISQKIPEKILNKEKKNLQKGSLSLDLKYESLTSESDEIVVGIVTGLKNADDDYYIQIQSESDVYNSSKIKLKDGKFIANNVLLEPNKSNLFWIYLFDDEGNSLPVEPNSFSIVHGISVSEAPLPHSVGIVLAKKDLKNNFIWTNEREVLFEKGLSLPLKHLGKYKTVRKLEKNEIKNELKIIIDEGESDIPDRNVFACELGINGKDLPYDLPESTEVEITIEINRSREITADVYIPLVDKTVQGRSTILDEIIDVSNLEAELTVQTEKANNILEDCSSEERGSIQNTIQSAQTSVKNARIDEDEKRKARNQIRTLKIKLDKLENEKEMPQLIKEFNIKTKKVEELINEYADKKDKSDNTDQLSKIMIEGKKAIQDNDKTLLIRVNEQMEELKMKALFSNPQTWTYYFRQIETKYYKYTNKKDAQYYLEKGNKAVENGDSEEVKRCVRNLWELMPVEEQKSATNNLSGITK